MNPILDPDRAPGARLDDALRDALGTRPGTIGALGLPAETAGSIGARQLKRFPAPSDLELDALVWRTEGPTPAVASSLPRVRLLLAERGRLYLVVPRDTAGTAAAKANGRATARQEAIVALSERGFVVLEERTVGGAEPADMLVARPTRLSIRGYRAGDEVAIGALFGASFGTERRHAAWRWKFVDHPWGDRLISLAWDQDRLVGQYAALAMRLVRPDGTEDRALQLCDIMTAPAVRTIGRGKTAVLVRMLRHLYACWGEHRIGFVIGWNTATSRAFALRFTAGHEVEPVGYWTRPAVQTTARAGYRVRVIERFGARFDRFFDRVAPAYGYLQRRDRAYLAWRFRQPGVTYLRLACYRWGRLVGWSVFRRLEDRLVWGDGLIDAKHEPAARALLAAALESEIARGAREVSAWFASRPGWWRSTIERLGFEPRPEPNDLSLIYGIHSEPRAGELLHRLFYTMADSDLF